MSTHTLRRPSDRHPTELHRFVLGTLNERRHGAALALYAAIVATHFLEHLLQVAQVFALGRARSDAGGLLGEVFPALAANEVLHTAYNSAQLTGLLLLLPGFAAFRAARRAWLVALVAQSWHAFEHAFLQLQFLTGVYYYGALKQMSVLERFLPRIELHFAYNLAVVVPTAVALVLYARARARGAAPHPGPDRGRPRLNA
jgi:hypothetical protein